VNTTGQTLILDCDSIAGHKNIFIPGLSLSLYAATKHAVTATCEGLRQDAKNAGRKLRVTVRNIQELYALRQHSQINLLSMKSFTLQ